MYRESKVAISELARLGARANRRVLSTTLGTLFLAAAALLTAPNVASAQTPPPLPVTAGLYAWYTAGYGVTSSGGVVQSWADQSGNGNDMVLNSGSPTYSANALYGHPTISVNSGDSLVTSSNFVAGLTSNVYVGDGSDGDDISPDLTIFVVYSDTTDPSAESHPFQFGENYGGVYSAVMMGKIDGYAGVALSSGYNIHSSYTGPYSSPLIQSFRYNAGADVSTLPQSSFKVNGVPVYTDGPTDDPSGDGNVISLDPDGNIENQHDDYAWVGASDAIGSPGFAGNVSEIIVYNSVLTDTQEAAVGAYLSQEYSLNTAYAPTENWTGGHGSSWNDSGNWSGAIPGATSGKTSTDVAYFDQSVSNTTVVIDALRNVQSIIFDTANVSSMTIGSTNGNALLLTANGAIGLTATVANSQTVNAPLTFEGDYTFINNASSATLTFGGAIAPATSSGAMTLTLGGTNTGDNAINGVLADSAGSTLALTANGGTWVLGAVNTSSGPTSVAAGTLQIGNGSSGTLNPASAISVSGGALVVAGGGSLGNNSIAISGGTMSVTSGGSVGAAPITVSGSGTLVLAAGGLIGNAAISVSSGGTFAPQPGSGAVAAGATGGGSAGATLSVGPGGTFSMVDGAIGTFNLQQQNSFAGPALTLNTANLNFDLSSAGADELVVSHGNASVSGVNTIGISSVGASLASGVYPLIAAPAGLSGTYQFSVGGNQSYATIGSNIYQLTLNYTDTVASVAVAPAQSKAYIQDTFAGTTGATIVGNQPNVVDLPGGKWARIGPTSTTATYAAGNQAAITSTYGGIWVPAHNGTYTPTNVLTISAGLEVGTGIHSNSNTNVYYGAAVGFSSSLFPLAGGNVNAVFNAVALDYRGKVDLYETYASPAYQFVPVSVPWPTATLGAFSTTATYTVSFAVNTTTGQIYDVSVSNGSVTDTADFAAIDNYDTTGIFTALNTVNADIVVSSTSAATGFASNFQVLAATGPSVWTGGASTTNWADSGNWMGGVPGSTSGTTNKDTATFNQSASFSPTTIDAGRNLQNITFDLAVNSLTIGTTGGNPLYLTSSGTIQTRPVVASPEVINAPLVLEGNYAFTSNATLSSATLTFGGAITPAAMSGTTTLTLNGTNTGANTVSGVLADNGSGKLAVSVGGTGVWVLSGTTSSSTYTGGTSVAYGATLELAGAVSAVTQSQNIANSGSLTVGGSANQKVGTVLGAGNVTVNAGATLTAYQIRQNSLTIGSGATVSLSPSGSGSTTHPALPNNINFSSSLTSLSIAGTLNAWTGTLDIGNNGLAIAYGTAANDPYATIDNMIESGYKGGVWGGTGITSTLVQAGVAMNISTPLNIGLLDFTPGTGNFTNQTFLVFEGQTITTNAVLVRLTYMDDLVLAGDLAQNNSTSDALLFAANFGSGTTWSVGDLTHDGMIDSNDALLFAANFTVGLPSLDGTTGNALALGGDAAAVPEPSPVILTAFGILGLVVRRRIGRARAAHREHQHSLCWD